MTKFTYILHFKNQYVKINTGMTVFTHTKDYYHATRFLRSDLKCIKNIDEFKVEKVPTNKQIKRKFIKNSEVILKEYIND